MLPVIYTIKHGKEVIPAFLEINLKLYFNVAVYGQHSSVTVIVLITSHSSSETSFILILDAICSPCNCICFLPPPSMFFNIFTCCVTGKSGVNVKRNMLLRYLWGNWTNGNAPRTGICELGRSTSLCVINMYMECTRLNQVCQI